MSRPWPDRFMCLSVKLSCVCHSSEKVLVILLFKASRLMHKASSPVDARNGLCVTTTNNDQRRVRVSKRMDQPPLVNQVILSMITCLYIFAPTKREQAWLSWEVQERVLVPGIPATWRHMGAGCMLSCVELAARRKHALANNESQRTSTTSGGTSINMSP